MVKETCLAGWDSRSSVCSNQDVDKELREPEISWDLIQPYVCDTELKKLMLLLQLEKNTEQTQGFFREWQLLFSGTNHQRFSLQMLNSGFSICVSKTVL